MTLTNSMPHEEGLFTGAENAQLYYQAWLPAEAPRAVLVIIHGFGEHSGRYHHVIDYLQPRDYAIYALDLRGHGRSPGDRGSIDRWEQYLTDVDALVELVKAAHPELPLFLMGHSMGGLILTTYLVDHQAGITGAVLSSPLLEEVASSGFKKQAVKALSKLAPGVVVNSTLDPTVISREPAEVQRYAQDPLVHAQATARLAGEMMRVIPLAHAQAGRIKLPVLLYHGEGDLLVSIRGSQRIYNELGSSDRIFNAYPGGYHELHNDIDRAQVLADLHAWLERHID